MNEGGKSARARERNEIESPFSLSLSLSSECVSPHLSLTHERESERERENGCGSVRAREGRESFSRREEKRGKGQIESDHQSGRIYPCHVKTVFIFRVHIQNMDGTNGDTE